MHHSKLIKTLQTLDRKAFNDLKHFYHSKFITINEKAVVLLDYILTCKPDFTSGKLEKRKAFARVFRNAAFDDTKMRLLISDALKAVYQFIGTSKILDDPVAFEMSLLEHFDKTESNELTLKRFEEFRKKVESFPYQNEDYFYYIFRLEELKRNYFVRRTQDYDLSDMFRSLEGFYFLKKLKLICVRLSHNYIFKQEVDENFLSEINNSLKQKIYFNNPIITGYSYAILLLTSEDPHAHFLKLFDLLNKKAAQISPYDINTLSKILENYCIRQINTGQESYYDSLYLLLERRLWQSEKLSTSEVMTFFTLCLRTGKAQTALKFIHEKKDFIFPPEIRPDAFNYSMAQYYFSCKNYDQVLSLLQQVEYVNVFYKISSKRLLIETFYELREWDSLESAMNAFRVFIHRNTEISDLHKKNNQNFINFLYKLINADSNKSPRRHRLQQALQRTPNIAERRWLMEQVEA